MEELDILMDKATDSWISMGGDGGTGCSRVHHSFWQGDFTSARFYPSLLALCSILKMLIEFDTEWFY